MRVALGLSVALLLFRPAAVWGQELVTDLSEHLISIESTFTGAELLLFGAVEGKPISGRADVAIVVRGPSDDITIRRKARIGGIWVNYEAARFAAVPGYYAVVSTRALEDISSRDILLRHGIGTANLNLDITLPGGGDSAPFRQALLRLRSGEDLFQSDASGVDFIGETLFRANISLPANVPDGVFTASVYLFEDGKLINARTTPLYISKAGFERFVFDLAHRRPLTYGILAVIIAIFAGWAASVAFRKN